MRLSGLNIRKALELEISVEDIFQLTTDEEGDIAAREIYDEDITHTSEIENIEEIFGESPVLFYSTEKEEIIINDNLKAYKYDFYLTSLEKETIDEDGTVLSEKSTEIIFLNTKVLNYHEFLRNIMDAHSYLGQFPKNLFKRKFIGIGSFKMEEYALSHTMTLFADVHLLDFYIQDSNLVSTISKIITADYENDINEQKEYLTEEEYSGLLNTVKKHKNLISKGFDLGLK